MRQFFQSSDSLSLIYGQIIYYSTFYGRKTWRRAWCFQKIFFWAYWKEMTKYVRNTATTKGGFTFSYDLYLMHEDRQIRSYLATRGWMVDKANRIINCKHYVAKIRFIKLLHQVLHSTYAIKSKHFLVHISKIIINFMQFYDSTLKTTICLFCTVYNSFEVCHYALYSEGWKT